ncbi:MAG TPA: DMT family transporter [Stellaceae bacterium]
MTSLWIPLTVAAAFCQNLRTVLQKQLRYRLSTNGATFARYAFGSPLIILYVIGLHGWAGLPWPRPNGAFVAWMAAGSVTQILATSLLIHLFSFRNFAVGVAYSKTEVIQAAIFGLVFLGDTVTAWGTAAIAIGTLGVMLISLVGTGRVLHELLLGWLERPALIGLASGALFGIAAVSFRAAALSLGARGFVMPAAYTLLWANLLQTALLSSYLYAREREQFPKFFAAWRIAALTGAAGAAASTFWFMAMTIQLVAYVRTLGLIELVFTFAFSWFWFNERPRLTELVGIALLLLGIGMTLTLR